MLTTLHCVNTFCLHWLFLGLSKTVPSSCLRKRRDHFAHAEWRFNCSSVSWVSQEMMNGQCMTRCPAVWPVLFMSASARRKEDRVRWEEFTSWMAAGIRMCTDSWHCPESGGKTGLLLLAVPLISGFICGSTGKIHWRCIHSCSTLKWWGTVEVS